MENENYQKDDLYQIFKHYSITQLQKLVDNAATREESIFYNRLLNLKMVISQEEVVGRELL